jgi:hypothetical protein
MSTYTTLDEPVELLSCGFDMKRTELEYLVDKLL